MLQPDRDRLLADIYDELRRSAHRLLLREAPLLTLQPTELVNEALIRVIGLDRMDFADRQHLLATAARILRQTMIDEIRKRRAQKRQMPEVTVLLADLGRDVDIDRLGAVIERLDQISPDYAQLVDLRFFVGFTLAETAAVLGVSEPTVKRRWQAVRAWLADAIDRG